MTIWIKKIGFGLAVAAVLVAIGVTIFYLAGRYQYQRVYGNDKVIASVRHWQQAHELSRAGEPAKVQQKAVQHALMELLHLSQAPNSVFSQGVDYTLVSRAELQELACRIIAEGRQLSGQYRDIANRAESELKDGGFISDCPGTGSPASTAPGTGMVPKQT